MCIRASVNVVPPVVNVGGVTSAIQVIVLAAVAVLPQPSIAVNVLVCVRSQPLLPIDPSEELTVGVPQGSVALAVPSAALISLADGLHPSVNVVPPVVNVGGVTSAIQVIVLAAVAVLPQPSIAVNVLVCVRSQPLLPIDPSEELTVGVPQGSVALAVPSAALISLADGLHPSVNVVPPVVNVGGVTSAIQVIVLAAVAVLPQPSIAVNVLVCVRSQPLLPIDPSLDDTVGVPQGSVALAVPSAALISLADGLQPSVNVVPPVVNVGGVTSAIQVIVLDAVAVLPQPSIAVNVLVCVRSQPLLPIDPSLDDTVGVPQGSVALAVPSAALISLADGLHPSVNVVPPVVNVGGVTSAIQVIVLDAVAVLPQPSIAVNVLVCVRSQPLLPIDPSLD